MSGGCGGNRCANAAQLLNAHASGELVTGEFEKSECSSCTDCHGADPHAEVETAKSL